MEIGEEMVVVVMEHVCVGWAVEKHSRGHMKEDTGGIG